MGVTAGIGGLTESDRCDRCGSYREHWFGLERASGNPLRFDPDLCLKLCAACVGPALVEHGEFVVQLWRVGEPPVPSLCAPWWMHEGGWRSALGIAKILQRVIALVNDRRRTRQSIAAAVGKLGT